MKLTKKQEADVIKVYDAWLNSYLNGDVKTYDSYLDNEYHFIGSTGNEEFLNKTDTTKFFKETADQLAGKTDLKNKVRTIEFFEGLVFVTEVFDAYFLMGSDWSYYGRFRFTSSLRQKKEGWRFIYQHFSLPDSKAQEGETLGAEKISKENQELREAIKRRTAELEEKNRELEIETSLEKVRAVAMSMTQPDDLLNICEVLFKELTKIGFTDMRCALIHIFKDEKGYFDDYDYSDFTGGKISTIPYKGNTVVEDFLKRIRKSKDSFVELVVKGKALADFLSFRKKSGQINDKRLFKAKEINYYFFSVGTGNIGISNFGKINDEQLLSLKRFRNVFQLAYQRFTDISLAAAQAREAQIELALERVRARTMAMQKSEELSDTAYVLFQQFKELGEHPHQITIGIVKDKEGLVEFNITGGDGTGTQINQLFKLDINEPSLIQKLVKGWKENKKSGVIELAGKDLTKWVAYRNLVSGIRDNTDYSNARRFVAAGYFTQGLISISLIDPIAAETIILLERFAKVFEQTYTRFLDLQRAEAQAWEGQIEAGLERVRSRSMAMHHPSELQAVINTVHKELLHLNIAINGGSFIAINSDVETTLRCWGSGGTADTTNEINIPLYEKPFCTNLINRIKKELGLLTEEFTQKEKKEFFKFLFKHEPWSKLSAKQKKEILLSPGGYTRSCYVSQHTSIFIINHFGEDFSLADNDILQRFGKVFEQSYTRFLDLQKAETQAREAKIEAAVERVRAEAMAMHSTSDFEIVVKQILQQIQHLNLEGFTGAQIILIDEKEFLTVYDCSAPGNIGDPKSETIRYEAKKFPIMGVEILNKWKEGIPYFVLDFDLKKLRRGVKEWEKINVDIAGILKDAISGGHLTHQWDACGRLHNGMIAFDMIKPPDEDVRNIIIKMTLAFEQAYTRFLDLQKAEAQAREAQIELALERVRARTMAMQHSDELKDASVLLFQQVIALGVPAFTCGYNIWEKGEKEFTSWMSNADLNGLNPALKIPLTEDANFIRYNESKQKGEEFFVLELRNERMQEHYRYLRKTIPVFDEFFESMEEAGIPLPDTQIHHLVNFLQGNLLFITYKPVPESHDIFKRFGKVFEQTYTRFLDLQKAEAQVKEAQIEAALEKVRSRSLAMHKTDELQEVVTVVLERMTDLNIELDTININIYTAGLKEANLWTAAPGQKYAVPFNLPFFDHPFHTDIFTAKENGLDFFTKIYSYDEKNSYFKYTFEHSDFKYVPEDKKKLIMDGRACTRSIAITKNAAIIIIRYAEKPFSDSENEILKRFAKVFEQAYTRFLDLQKAEAQAREAQIEAALERVRSRSLAMHKSNELQEVIETVFDQILKLGILADVANFIIFNQENKDVNCWIASPNLKINRSWHMPYIDIFPLNAVFIEKENGNDSFSASCSIEQKNEFFNWAFEHSDFKYFPDDRKQFVLESKSWTTSYAWVKHTGIQLSSYTRETFVENENEILKRFARVFEQSYTRFLDLQKAEAQAREAKIEVALERTRTQSMIMQHSKELDDTLQVFHEQVQLLGIHSAFSFLWLPDEEKDKHIFWAIWEEDEGGSAIFKNKAITYPLDRNEPATKQCLVDWKSDEQVHSYAVPAEGVENYFAAWQELMDGVEKIKPEYFRNGLYYIEAFMKYGCFGVMVEKDIKEDEKKILGRFAVEFERTYTRFLDLQKAEAQAREAQIEAALERVRSRSMGMQKSEELKEVIQVVYDQFIHLNINVEHTGFILDYKQRDDMHIWLADRNKIQNEITFAYFDSPHWNSFINAKKNGLNFFSNHLNFQEKNKFYHDLFKIIPELPKEVKDYYFNCDALAISTVLIDNVGLYIENFKGIPYTNEENNTLLRFGKVFQQTYTRFLDLQKAEAQAREAQIEVSLERVRSRSMAMQKSYELPELSSLLFQQVKELGVTAIQNSIGIVNEKTGFVELSTTIHGSHVLHTLNVPMDEQYVMAKAITAWKAKRKSLTLEFEGQELKNYNELRNSFLETKVNFPNDIWIVNFSFFSKGWLSFSTDKNVSDEIIAVIKRFAAVFEQTYTRFLDLQKAEAQAKEALIEAGLERVRSRTLAMQTSDELADTSIVIFEQLINLGIEPNRLFIGIIKEETHSIEAWATNEDGTKIDNHFTLQTDKNISVNKMYEGWKQKKTSTSIDMKGKELLDYFHYLSDEMQIPFQGGLTQKRRVQTIAYFGQGLIGMASPEEQPAATTQLLERFAAVFNLTYTRFNDLKIVEAHAIQAEKDLVQITNAKQSAEAALVELQATQKQLIQSEKMASLGELTAGIAHEIQNPLNFVNNFSEVSKELLGEMREEMDKGNLEDVKAIMNDIIQNLEKINNHGKRADAIVKGMLQHSQSSTGKKEPIDINALCDEYLRLSYHGLRAKDKTFNASFKTDFDNSIGNINIVAQDIGRVILNLINNAFYAVAEKHKQNIPGYEPTVTVSTRLVIPPSGGQRGVEIKVIDNGNGIPPKVLEKIFQPFFTTKPTGQGTGLGLSLSYDIIKAHGGEVKVETLSAEAAAQAGKEGEGSTFILQLPIT